MKKVIDNITSLEELVNVLELDKRKSNFGIKDKDIPEKIISTFLKLKDVKSVTFYRINQKDFNFERILTKPINHTLKIDRSFDELMEHGLIGRSLQSLQSIIFPESPLDNNDNFVIVPLSDGLKPNGLLLIYLENHWDKESKKYLLFANIIGNHFSNIFTIYQKNNKIREIEKEYEKKISAALMQHIKSKNELNTFLDALQNGVVIYSQKTGKIFRSNPVAVKLTGYDEFELSKMSISDIVDTSNSVEEEHYETYLINKDKEKIPIIRKSKLVFIRDSEYMVDSFLDITDIKKANETLLNLNKILEEKVNSRTKELQKTIKKLNKEIDDRVIAQYNASQERSMNQMKSKFISTVSHEFRTPLTIIRTSADLLDKYYDKIKEDDRKKYLMRVVQTSDYLSQVLQNILYLQDVDNTMLGASGLEFQLNEVINDLILSYIQKTENKIKIYTDFDDENLFLFQNKGLVKTIIDKIFQNAIIYGNNSDIIIKVREIDNIISIEIKDKGIGIPEEEITQIFDLFYRGKNVGNIPGVGLGLPIVKHCLNIMNGKIEIDSKLNEGTNVLISIQKYFNNLDT